MQDGNLNPDGFRSPAFKITAVGAAINLFLSAAKIAVGVAASSAALISDGLHSTSDLLSDVMVFFSIHRSTQPADACHPFGHRRYQSLTSLFVGMLLGGAGLYMLYECITTYRLPHDDFEGWLPFWVAVSGIVLKELLYRATYRIGRDADDRAVMANAWHHRSDAFSSIAAAAGILGAQLGGPDWYFLDHLTGAVLAGYIVATAWKIGRAAASELADAAPDRKVIAGIENVLREIPGVAGFHALRARTMGGLVDMDLHVLVDPEITVREGHDIAVAVKDGIIASDRQIKNVVVHIEPAEDTE